ncbi:hypothetical protein [Actinocatenispora sera]|uniref:Membrane protein n=1 Tax=Actinocatenispora sera TaxID=390989 RepID=A0A810L081_9ACTN|nr:hypothetical protein [Actinocatenispora sera]BCJ28179.1 membrane protein [Actinocatenispora sera]
MNIRTVESGTEAPDTARRRTVGPLVGIVLAVVAVQAALLTMFAWPALHSAPRDLPIVVAGPAPAAHQLAGQLAAAKPGAFEVDTVASDAAADRALRQRDAYGAFLIGRGGVQLHVASAASPQIAMLLRQVAQGAEQRTGTHVAVTDVVPTDKDDPNGVVLSIGILPLVMTSMLAGILLGLAIASRWLRLVGVLLFAALAGLASMAIGQYALGAVPGSYVLNAAVVGLLALAVAGSMLGLVALLGAPGAGLGVAVLFVVGIPLAGLTSAPALLPAGWGAVGQFLPPGAGGTLLRSVVYFDSAGAGTPLAVLAGWAVVGLALLLVGRAKPRRRLPVAA